MMEGKPVNKKVGWWNPKPLDPRSKWHYIGEDGRSLCGKWLHLIGPLEHGNDNSADNCAECKRRLEKIKRKAGIE
jgi:hypothetical protein